MSIQQAILRKIRLGQSFCSYSFKPLRKIKGQLVIQLQRDHFYLNKINKKSSRPTTCNQSAHQSRKSMKFDDKQKERTTHKSQKSQKSQRPFTSKSNSVPKQVFLRKKSKIKQKQIEDKQNTISYTTVNKMQQYISDYMSLKPDLTIKTNKIENIPKYSKYSFQINQQNKRIQTIFNKNSFNFKKFQSVQILQNFKVSNHLQFFHNFSYHDNDRNSPFVTFHIVNLSNKRHIISPVNQKLFSAIPIKQYQQKLNSFSVLNQQNIFFLALQKQIKENQPYPYTQGFFWIGKPIKHSQRVNILENISKFTNQFLIKLPKPQKQRKQKIWIVDFHGKISYINMQDIETNMHWQITEKYINQSKISNKNINQLCLDIYLCSVNKGIFRNSYSAEEQNVIQ